MSFWRFKSSGFMTGVCLFLSLVGVTGSRAMGSSFDWHAFTVEGFQVRKLDDSTLAIRGEIASGDYQKFRAIFDGNIKTVRLSGPGGSVEEAVKIGIDLINNDIDVIVDGPCLSSCANYLFLAGKHKTFEKEGFVGFHGSPWHGGLLQMGGTALNDFIDNRKISAAVSHEIENTKKSDPNVTMEEMNKRIDGYYRPLLRDNREFFKKLAVDDRLISNSVHGRFVEELPECHGFYPLSPSEKEREPFLFLTIKQMNTYGVNGLSGRQSWKQAYEFASLAPNNKRDDNSSFIFCVDAYDQSDLDNAIFEITR